LKDYETQKKNLEVFTTFLEFYSIQYTLVDEKLDTGQKYPVLKFVYRIEGMDYDVKLVAFFDWATARCYLFDTKTVNEKMACTIFQKCLELNYLLPNTTFSMYNRKIFSEVDMELTASPKEFEFEMNGLTYGIEDFTKFLKSQNLKTVGRPIS
jgi:hypothetical protein